MKEKDEYVYKIREINTNEVWLGDCNGVIKFAKDIAGNKSLNQDWMEENRVALQDIGFDFMDELDNFITDFKTAKSFIEIGDEYIITEISYRGFLDILKQGDYVSLNEWDGE